MIGWIWKSRKADRKTVVAKLIIEGVPGRPAEPGELR
jgi:hypothetical protein